MHLDLMSNTHPSPTFQKSREKIVEFVNYMQIAGKRPSEIRVFPPDWKAITGAFNRDFKRRARERERQENAKLPKKSKDKVKITPDVVESVCYGDIPVVCGVHNSRPRKFEP